MSDLRQMVTLTTALLAGSAALLSQLRIARACIGLSAGLLIISLVAALFGMFPREAVVNISCLEDIKKERDRGMQVKMRCLKIAGACLVAAFCVLVYGLMAS